MSKYELMYIVDTSLEEAPRKELIDRVHALITDNGGEVEKVDEWGKRRLAYPINYKNEGYYVLVNFSSGPDLPHEIERVLQISEAVLRYLVIKIEAKHTSVKPRPVAVRPQFARPVQEAQQDAAPAPVQEAQQDAAPAPVQEAQQDAAPAPVQEAQQDAAPAPAEAEPVQEEAATAAEEA